MRCSKSLSAALVIVAGVGLGATSSNAQDLVQVSGGSPFAECTADGVENQSGVNFPDSEVEPWIDVNPNDPDNLVGAWQQDRWSNGGARGLVVGASFDGGENWTVQPIRNVTLCSGGTEDNGGGYQRATDPWVTFGPDGVVYQLSLSFNDSDFKHALLASKSDDGGLSWSDPIPIKTDSAPTVFNDKQSITADPHDATHVYAIWDRLVYPNEKANVKAAFHAAAYRGPIWFARSTDGGNGWEPARPIYDPGQNSQTIGNQIVVLPKDVLQNYDLVNVFNLIHNENKKGLRGSNVAVIRSSDRGVTWSKPIVVAKLGSVPVRDPETGEDVRTGDIIPDVAVDPSSGALYIVWQDARFSGFQNDGIALSMSADGGRTWSAPIKVNQTPTDRSVGNQQAFTPSVAVAKDGTVAVTYYDFRDNTSDPNTLSTDYFIVRCDPAASDCANPASWSNEARLTSLSFDMRKAPLTSSGYFVGDYEGLTSVGNGFLPFFSQSHDSDPASIFFGRVSP